MEYLIGSAFELISSADQYILAISGVLLALAGVAKLTKTKKDDKYVQLAIDYLNKAKGLLGKFKPKAK